MKTTGICVVIALAVAVTSCGSSTAPGPTGGPTPDPAGGGVTGSYTGTITSKTATAAAYVKIYLKGSTLFMMPSQTPDFSAAKEFTCGAPGATLTCTYEDDYVDAHDPRNNYHRFNSWSGTLSAGQWTGSARVVFTFPNAPAYNSDQTASFSVKK